MSVKHLHLIAVAAMVACAPSTSGTSHASAAPRSSNALAVEEITAFSTEGRTAFDVVSRLRPAWLRARGVQSIARGTDSTEFALVVVDGHPMGRIGTLRDIPAYELAGMRYYDMSEAGGKFGERGANGVIEVRLKSPR
ncbi:MAG TPA: hypothetical protein VEK37_04135 [Gemmatimonadaceae bacterium]|nr:hypothetical protein [Gemmatimonadaceae bacterium]